MKHIFYIFAILPILWELFCLQHTKKVMAVMTSLRGKQEKTGSEKTVSALMFGYLLWTFVGLFSSQWILFGVIIFLGAIFPKKNAVLVWIDAAISFSVLVFIILNAYHFKIDIFALLIK